MMMMMIMIVTLIIIYLSTGSLTDILLGSEEFLTSKQHVF